MNLTKKIFFPVFLFFVFSCLNNTSFASLNPSCEVSDKEFLMLTLISYNDDVKNKSPKNVLEGIIKRNSSSHNEITDFISSGEAESWEIVYYEIDKGKNKDGFSVFVFQKGVNIVVVPRGTDGGLFSENWKYFFYREHPQAKHMKNFVEKNLIPYLLDGKNKDKNCKLYFCGHSLGGYLSLYGSGVLLGNKTLARRLVKVITFNGLGLDKATRHEILVRLKNLEPWKIVNYRISMDLVSLIGDHFTPMISFNLPKQSFEKQLEKWKFIVKYNIFAHKLARFFIFLQGDSLTPNPLPKNSTNGKSSQDKQVSASYNECESIFKVYENFSSFIASSFIGKQIS